jgi:glucosamine--fructose-6-phosphate aminotransferase (isomerizing)
MCRIFGGIIEKDNIAPILRIGLKRLEYGGYDSAGIATVFQKKIFIKKDKGKIDEIHARLNFDDLPGNIGIAHTRWATHGAPSQVNAHPLTDCEGKIAVVHNGIIDNYLEIKKELEQKGHVFLSKTDTEIVAHLIEENYKLINDITKAFILAIKRIHGSFAIAVISSFSDDKIFVAKKNSPLLIGVGKNENFIASDAVAFIDRTKEILALNDNEIAMITQKDFLIYDIKNDSYVKRKTKTYDWNFEIASKGGYEHFMLKEIMEQPISISWTLNIQKPYLELVCEYMNKASKIFLVASGTSYNSCIAGSYYYSNLANIASYPSVASEFIDQFGNSVDINSSILCVSQSGETMDVLQAAEFAKAKGSTILAITNVAYSTLTRMARAYVLQQSGPEIGVAATKTYTSQLLVHLMLAYKLGIKRGKLSQYEIDKLQQEMQNIPPILSSILTNKNTEVKNIAKLVSHKNHVVFLGKGLNFATALEGKLKLLEISYIPSTTITATHKCIEISDKKVTNDTALIAIVANDKNRKFMLDLLEQFRSKMEIIAIGDEFDYELYDITKHVILMPSINLLFTPITYILPLQLLAYYSAIYRRLDPDKPRNLAKSVTVV